MYSIIVKIKSHIKQKIKKTTLVELLYFLTKTIILQSIACLLSPKNKFLTGKTKQKLISALQIFLMEAKK